MFEYYKNILYNKIMNYNIYNYKNNNNNISLYNY